MLLVYCAIETLLRCGDVAFLMSHMYRYAYKWKEIGLALNFQPCELENISCSTHPTASAQEHLAKLLSLWCQWPTADHSDIPTMEKLHDALCSGMVGLGAMAEELYHLRKYLPSHNK